LPQRILVVDDDKSIVKVLSAYLEQSGYQAIPAYDGEMALHALRRKRFGLRFNLIAAIYNLELNMTN
jgi:DNA-binding response OmpR family regulator